MNKIVIPVKDVVKGTSTNEEALPLFDAIDNILSMSNIAVLSLKDCAPMSSSFLNSSVGVIIEKYGFDLLKGKLSIVDYTPSMAEIFKSYIESRKTLAHA